MGEIEQGLERAVRTRPLPQSVPARPRHLLKGAGGSTEDPRERHITQYLPGSVAARLYSARDNGAGEREQEQILAEALQEHYFKDNGHRAAGLSAEFTDIAWATIEPH
ncbi:hypothetical protein AB0O31_33075 [Kitasatospora cineracea]|uniref:hypothetical protein n=1 Tax=Kitasatospora cineracea TaxID=88074 RepID=UPI00341A0C58